jgi:hypothetical protein
MALRHHLHEELRIFNSTTAKPAIEICNKKIKKEIEHNKKSINAIGRLYSARRSFVLQHGHYLQIPTTWADLGQFVQAAIYLLRIELISLPFLLWGYFWNNAPLARSILLVLVLVSVAFGATNDPPQIMSTPVLNANLGVDYSYQVVAIDSNVIDILTYSIPVQPGFLSINSATGIVSGTPPDTGSFVIKIVVSDILGATDVQDYQLDVVVP